MTTKTLTTAAVARLAGVHRNTIGNYIRRGLIAPRVLSDGTHVFAPEDARLIRELATQGRGRGLRKGCGEP